MTVPTGITSRLLSASSLNEFSNHPQLKIISVALYWDEWEATYNTFTYGALSESSTTGTIADAHRNGYVVMFRLFMGRDAPLSTWMSTNYPTGSTANNFHPVNRLEFLSNEASEMWPSRAAGTLSEYIPDVVTSLSYTNYRYHIQRVLTEINRYMNRPCPLDATHKISRHILAMPCAGPTENGDEFSMNDHRYAPAYQGTATLQGGLTKTTTSFVLAGATGNYLPSGGCWKILDGAEQPDGGKTERIDVTSFNTSTNTVTVLKRGHSGDDPENHLAGCVVQWSPAATAGAPQGSELATYGGYPSTGTRPYDVKRVCQRVLFDTVSGASTAAKYAALVAAYKSAWIDNITDHMTYLPADVRSIVFGANLFNDNTDSADAVIQLLGPTYTTRLFAGTTNMDVASGASGFKYIYAQPGGHDFLVKAIAAGCLIGLQVAGTSRLKSFGDAANVTAAKQDIINVLEECIATYGAAWVEMQGSSRLNVTTPTITSTPIGGWLGGAVNQQQYLLTGSNAVNGRFVDPAPSAHLILLPGLPSTLTIGTPSLAKQTPQTISLTGRASTLAIGSPLVTRGPGKNLGMIGVPSTLTIGTLTVAVAKVVTLQGRASTLTIGTPLVSIGNPKTIITIGRATSLTIGTLALTKAAKVLTMIGRASTLTIGTPTVTKNTTGVTLTGVPSTLTVGSPVVKVGVGKQLRLIGVDSALSIGLAALALVPPDDTDEPGLKAYNLTGVYSRGQRDALGHTNHER